MGNGEEERTFSEIRLDGVEDFRSDCGAGFADGGGETVAMVQNEVSDRRDKDGIGGK